MKALIYCVGAGLLLVLLIVLAVAIAHLPWWGAVLLVALAAWTIGQVAPVAFGVASVASMSEQMGFCLGTGLLVHGVERCTDVEPGDGAVFWIELTVTPRQLGERPTQWAPSELRFLPAPATVQPPQPRGRRSCRACTLPVSDTVAVVRMQVLEDGQFMPLAHGLLTGEQRLRVKFVAPSEVRQVRVQVGWGISVPVDLPAA